MKRRSDTVRDAFLVALAACGGAMDAASYLRLHAFTANMTGNTVILGLSAGGRHLADTVHAGLSIAAFAAGAFVGTLVGAESSEKDPWPAKVAVPFVVEIALLLAFAVCWTLLPAPDPALLLAVGSAAMGVQSGITHDVHLAGASTTYMSGTLARTMEFFADTLRFGFNGGMVLNGVTWVVYLAAALAVGGLDERGGNVAVVLWAIPVVVAAVALGARPAVRAARVREQASP
ncbi:MAG TPA: YoaK family protein [Candidatus Baltobacteraceae bacterium]|nr:YoaK family protein [Candidatus Baltobacteraceae bacterium]